MRGDCCHGVATGPLTGLRRPPSHSRRRGDCCIGEGRGPGPGQNFRNPGREQERASRQARLLEAFQSRHQVGVSVGFRFELPANRGLSRSHKRRHRGRAVGPCRRFQRWSALVSLRSRSSPRSGESRAIRALRVRALDDQEARRESKAGNWAAGRSAFWIPIECGSGASRMVRMMVSFPSALIERRRDAAAPLRMRHDRVLARSRWIDRELTPRR